LIWCICTKKQGGWRESRNGHLFWYPQKDRNKYINICFILFFYKNGKEREVKKKQRIKRDRMLTNFMSLFLEGRLFVWRFLIWDLSLRPFFFLFLFFLPLSLSKKGKLKLCCSCLYAIEKEEQEWPSRSKSTIWTSSMLLQQHPLRCFSYNCLF